MQYETQEFRAEAKFQRVSPQKAKLVLDLIKGRRVEDALQTVAFTRKRVAPLVEKVLRSALENANYLSEERGLDLDVDNLYVKTAVANEGPRLKRIRPAPMGRAFRYQRRTSMLLITVAEKRRPELAHTAEAEPVAGAKSKRKSEKKPAAKKSSPPSSSKAGVAKSTVAKKKTAAKKTAK
jgi:large subunit ribosomal protein L22